MGGKDLARSVHRPAGCLLVAFRIRKVGQVAGRSTFGHGPAAPRFHEVFAEFLDVLRQTAAVERVLKERLIPSVLITVRVFNGCRLG